MKRIMITVAYDGSDFHGWQLQPNVRTVEGELNLHLSSLLGEEITVSGASRTDTGVHARGNLAVFDTNSSIPPEKIAYALNSRLPDDVKIQGSKEVELDFHPRKRKSSKTYTYTIINREFPNPVDRRYAYFTYTPLDEHLMNEGAKYLLGEHDFTSFCAAASPVEDKVRTIYSIFVKREGEKIIISVTGSGFLYNMVRIIAGTLIEAGRGKIAPYKIKEIIEAKDRTKAGPTAPPEGLMLMGYEWEEEFD